MDLDLVMWSEVEVSNKLLCRPPQNIKQAYFLALLYVILPLHNIGKNAEVEFGAFSFITSPLMKCSKSYFMSLHEYMDLTRA